MIWVLAVVTALMTAFYMFRLMSMTFFGPYRGPAWEPAAHGHGAAGAAHTQDVRDAARHGAPHPADPLRTGTRTRTITRCRTGPPTASARPRAGHGHGAWHGPHESPAPMTCR